MFGKPGKIDNIKDIDNKEDESPLVFFERQIDWFLSVASKNDFSAQMFVFMGLVAINAKSVSKRAEQMMHEHDVISQSLPYIIKGQELGIIKEDHPLTLSILFYSSIQGFAEAFVSLYSIFMYFPP